MPVSDERVTFSIKGGTANAYVAIPTTPLPWPALIVIHPITGLEEMMMERTREFAKAGYLTVAPDIYSNDPGYAAHEPEVIESAAHIWLGRDAAEVEVVLQTFEPAVRQRILAAHEWVMGRSTTTYIDIVAGCFEHVRARAGVKAIGSIGYCMGGRLTAELAATGVDLSAAVIFYGTGPKPEAIPNVNCPVQGHYAVTDRGITGKVYDFALAMHAAGKMFEYSVYNADHGFGEPRAKVYNAEAALISSLRSNAFLAKHLELNASTPRL
jgi:carboxymethylenebutenolidase